ncbi:MAG: GntR family transcriptional regulator [Terracidiphilus sp.]|nr:GntR family transcriptional regulator [Terracidiphilus sp.]
MNSVQPEEEVVIERKGVIEHASPVPYYFQFCTYAESKIKAKEWRSGQLFPSEQELCEILGVSRTVVRQAMSELQRKGLIQKQNGKRSAIAAPAYEAGLMQTLRGLYQDVTQKGKKLTTQVMQLKVVEANAEVAAALQLPPGTSVIQLDRLRFIDATPEVFVSTYLPEAICPQLLQEDFSGQSLYEVLAVKFGLRIAQGKRTIEAITLNREEGALLGLRAGKPALLLRSIGQLEDGTPLEYFVAKHRGDRSKFEVVFALPKSSAKD